MFGGVLRVLMFGREVVIYLRYYTKGGFSTLRFGGNAPQKNREISKERIIRFTPSPPPQWAICCADGLRRPLMVT